MNLVFSNDMLCNFLSNDVPLFRLFSRAPAPGDPSKRVRTEPLGAAAGPTGRQTEGRRTDQLPRGPAGRGPSSLPQRKVTQGPHRCQTGATQVWYELHKWTTLGPLHIDTPGETLDAPCAQFVLPDKLNSLKQSYYLTIQLQLYSSTNT